MMPDKTYLGDGVFAEKTVAGLVLTTNDGYRDTNRIVLDERLWEALEVWLRVKMHDKGDNKEE